MPRIPGLNITQRVVAPWGLKRLHSATRIPDLPVADRAGVQTYQAGYDFYYYTDFCGQNVTIYILDDLIRHSHFQFKKISRVIYDAEGKPTMEREDPTARIEEAGEPINVAEHHGIAVASVAAGLTYGVAPAAAVVGIGYTVTGDELLEKMAGFQAPAVLNISNQFPPDAGMTRALVSLIRDGVHIVIAAGNEHIIMQLPAWDLSDLTPDNGFPESAEHYRGLLSNIIWVGGSSPRDKTWVESAYGPHVDVFAPGEFVQSAMNNGDEAAEAQGGFGGGTSIAAPHVSGIIACLLSYNNYVDLTPAQMKAKILAMAWQDAIELLPGEVAAGTTRRLACANIERWTLGDP